MLRTFSISLLCFFSCTICRTQITGTWNGRGEYLPGDSNGVKAQKQGVEKWLVMQVNPNGQVNGTLRMHYTKVVNPNFIDPQYNFVGEFDAAAKRMMLTIQIPKPQGPEPYYKVDNRWFSYRITQIADSLVMILQTENKMAVDVLDRTLAESNQFQMLPTRIRMVHTERVVLPVRKKDIQHTIFLDTSFIRIDLYDNGEIDGDIATLLLDGKTIVRTQLLARKPVSLSLDLSKEPAEHLLEMFADNLGSIPPNTALLVLTCKQKRYELNLSSNGKVNGSVKLVVKP